MFDSLKPAVAALQTEFGAEAIEFRNEVTLIIQPEKNVEALLALRDRFGYDFLIDVTAVDAELASRLGLAKAAINIWGAKIAA